MNTRKVLLLAATLEIGVIGSHSSFYATFGLALIPAAIGFAFLLVVPGALVLELLDFRPKNLVSWVLFSAGTSTAIVMFLGGAISMTAALLGLAGPLSSTVVVFMVMLVCSVMMGALIRRPRVLRSPTPIDHATLTVDWRVGISALLPLIAVAGTAQANAGEGNGLLLVLIALVSGVFFLTLWPQKLPPWVYPSVIATSSLSLLLHTALISSQLVGYDIHTEYYFYRLTAQNHFWDPSLRSNVGAMLSVTVLPVVYQYFTGVSGVLLFKVLYPLIFCLVPVGLYELFVRFFSRRQAFAAVFVFMAFYGFYKEMTQLARQEVAELFLVLLLLLLVEKETKRVATTALVLAFSFAIVVSHYGIGIILMIMLPTLSILAGILYPHRGRPRQVSWIGVTCFVVFGFAWYMYSANASIISSVSQIGRNIYIEAARSFFDPLARDPAILAPLGSNFLGFTIWRKLSWITNNAVQVFILAGFVLVVRSRRTLRSEFDPRYTVLAAGGIAFILVSIVVPALAPAFNLSRIYQVSLIFVSPLLFIGAAWTLRQLRRAALGQNGFRRTGVDSTLLVAALLVVPYFLFQSGFAYAVTGDSPTSFALGSPIGDPRFSQQDASAAEWLAANFRDPSSSIVADAFGSLPLLEQFPSNRIGLFTADTDYVQATSCIFLRGGNVEGNIIEQVPGGWRNVPLNESIFNTEVLQSRNLVFTDGAGEVLC